MKTIFLGLLFIPSMHAFADSSPTFFDAHVHLNDVAMQNDLMQQTGISRAVVFSGAKLSNSEILSAAQAQRGKFFPFLSVSPEKREYARMWRESDTALLKYVEKQLETKQFYGLGELSIVHFPAMGFPETENSPLHPLMIGIMELAAKYKLPVMVHCEITYIKELERLLEKFPAVTLIWAHGGYAQYYLTKRMLEAHKNLVVELSMRALEGHPRSPDYWIFKDSNTVWDRWLELIQSNPRRFILGSDASHHTLASDTSKVQSQQKLLGQLPAGVQACVGTKNLEVVLGLGTYSSTDCPTTPAP